MMVYGNRTTKPPIYLGQNASSSYFPFYIAGTNRDGRNLYPYTRLLPRQTDNDPNLSKFHSTFAQTPTISQGGRDTLK